MNNKRLELASRICDCISDGYDDEELKKDAENEQYGEMEQTTEIKKKEVEKHLKQKRKLRAIYQHIAQIKCIRIQTIIYTGLSIKEVIYTF